MKSEKYFTPLLTIGGIAILGFFALPVSSAFAQYTSVDVSSTITAGPVINAANVTSSPVSPAGNLNTEAGANRFPRLLPPMKDSGAVLEQTATTTPLAPMPDAANSFFRGFTGLTH